ncbi:polysaccharide biosynthesis C-terminal domain-containing protein [Pseudonocardia nematodicida]|uniref:Polysaccharide biosynthesis C-terminal domain-containing protein n=1 Tax=Pseudonocardia nematodicida TaxID=1206997 RepID=A0ABV1K682_9PSEU
MTRAAVLRRVAGSGLARDTGWALTAEVLRLATSLGAFLVVTHLLSPGEYGVYIGTLGLMWFVLPFASCGAAYLLLQRVAGEGVDLATAMGRANGMVVTGGVLVTLLIALTRPVLLPQTPALVIVLLALAELVFGGMTETSMLAGQALGRLRLTVWVRLLQGASRLVAAVGLIVVDPAATLVEWAWLHLATAAVAALAGQWLLRVPGPARIPLHRPRLVEVTRGFPFSVGFGAEKFRESADSMLLLRIGTATDTGIFGAAVRLLNLALTPLMALIASSNARIFAAGARSVGAARAVARRVTAIGLAYAAVAAVVVAVAGPVAVAFLPAGYAAAGDALRLLAVLPIAVAAESFVATAMTAIGHQRIRVASVLAGTAVNVALNVALIPTWGWRGVVVASVAASVLNTTLLWSAIMVLAARERRT